MVRRVSMNEIFRRRVIELMREHDVEPEDLVDAEFPLGAAHIKEFLGGRRVLTLDYAARLAAALRKPLYKLLKPTKEEWREFLQHCREWRTTQQKKGGPSWLKVKQSMDEVMEKIQENPDENE